MSQIVIQSKSFFPRNIMKRFIQKSFLKDTFCILYINGTIKNIESINGIYITRESEID